MSLTYLPADLPENWQTGQILSPTGTEVGLSEQHGHNYLMKAVNDAHKACNRLREDNEKLCEKLSNKVNVFAQCPGTHISDLRGHPSGIYGIGPAVAGMPRDGQNWIALAQSDGTNSSLLLSDGDTIWTALLMEDGTMFGWSRMATASPPIEYELQLYGDYQVMPGADYGCVYYKAQDNMVHIEFSISRKDGGDFLTDTFIPVAYIPPGYAPKRTTHNAVYNNNVSGNAGVFAAQDGEHNDGTLYVSLTQPSVFVAGELTYLAK